jgi:hypothetical protein
MKLFTYTVAASLAFLCSAVLVQGQTSSTTTKTTTSSTSTSGDKSTVGGATNAARTDIYHVHSVHAASGKAAELGESFKTPAPGNPAPDHTVVFRHQYGDAWDYTVVAHYGTKFTVEAAEQQVPDSQRALSDSHTDTICNGPSWAEFSRLMGLDDPKKSTGSVYVVSFYRANPGQRPEVEKSLAEPPDPAVDKASGAVLMQHLEGANWHYCGIVRYNSWQDLATSEVNSVPSTSKPNSPWSQMRSNVSYHTDTLCDRLMP